MTRSHSHSRSRSRSRSGHRRARCRCGVFILPARTRCSGCVRSCENCARHSPTVTQMEEYMFTIHLCDILNSSVRNGLRRKFCHLSLPTQQTHVHLCSQCKTYLESPHSLNEDAGILWPSFVWSLLKLPDRYQMVWQLVPSTWREWWIVSVSLKHNVTQETLRQTPCLFKDVTNEYRMDATALNSLKWTDLMQREQSLVLPTVRCPGGCSEFKHQCKELPFDVVWEECLQMELDDLISNKSKRAFTRFFRKDYLQHTLIANNPNWICKPSLLKHPGKGPTVLCCRHHEASYSKQYVHVPRNPTGSLSSHKSGGLSPVVPIPRTIQKAKMASYSASFQMAYMEGSYYGVDTMYLSSEQGITSNNSALGWQQDVLSYSGRSDVRAYTRAKYEPTWGLPGSIATEIDKSAEGIEAVMPMIKNKYGLGATYVSLEDSVNLQNHVDFGQTETGVFINESGREQRVQFKGNYPVKLVLCHDAGSHWGARPFEVPKFRSQARIDTRAPWLLSSMMLLVPEFWNAVASVKLKKEWNWEGHMLAYLTDRYLPHINACQTRNSPFKPGISEKKIVNDIVLGLQAGTTTNNFSMDRLKRMLSRPADGLCGVQVSEGRFPDNVQHGTTIVIITRDYVLGRPHDFTWAPTSEIRRNEGGTWKLCYLAETSVRSNQRNANAWSGQVLARYSSSDLTEWWKIQRSSDFAERCAERLGSSPTGTWDICMYISTESCLPQNLRDKMLASCGGQGKTYCKLHEYPLITATKKEKRPCCCRQGPLPDITWQPNNSGRHNTQLCGKKAQYVCTISDCSSAICKNHQTSVLEWNGKFYLGTQSYYSAQHVAGASRANIPFQCETIPFLNERITERMSTLRQQEGHQADQLDGQGHQADEIDGGNGTSGWIPDDDGEQFEAHFRLQDMLDDNFVTETLQGVDDFEDVQPVEEPDIAIQAEDRRDMSIPTTDAGTLPVYCALAEGDYTGATVNNHVLLNNLGHMLIRRNTKLAGTLNQRHFLQKLAGRVPGDSLPLAYPEGMLFSDIFYSSDTKGNTVGAIPSALLNADKVLSELGFASLESHYRTRLSNPGLLTSSNPKYHLFAFDCLSNLGLRGCDSRVILRRGFAEVQKDGGVTFKGRDEPIFDTHQVDCRPIVNQLAAAVNQKPPTYFYTHTCSMKTHFGLKLIWEWLSSDQAIESLCSVGETEEEKAELRQNLIDGCGVLLLRSWMEIMHIWITYITKSSERPIGEVDDFFFRMELQDAKANLPHLHALIWTKDDLSTEEGLARATDRIRGFVLDIIRPEEREAYIRDGIFEDNEAVSRFLAMVTTFLSHHHTRRCYAPMRKRKLEQEDGGDETLQYELRCKANNNYKDNPIPAIHSFVKLPIEHSDDAIRILLNLELGKLDHVGRYVPSTHRLTPIKHYPPAHGDEGIISPCFGSLMARNPNMGNAQFATGYTLSRYLAKYIVSIDLYNTIKITPPGKHDDPNTFNVNARELPNQKITGNRLAHKQEEKSNKSGRMIKQRQGRGFNVVEFYMMLFGYSPIMTNISFQSISTRPFEERPARERIKPIDRLKNHPTLQNVALTALNCAPSHYVRQTFGFPQWRKFRDSQISIIFDDLQSPLSTSQVTKFGARPPELLFVSLHGEYREWFSEIQNTGNIEELMEWTSESMNGANIFDSIWIDGFTSHIRVRAPAIPSVLKRLQEISSQEFEGRDSMLQLFCALLAAVQYQQYTDQESYLIDKFVDGCRDDKLPIIWYESVRPTQTNRFLIHVLLSMGRFVDEYDLFSCGSMRESFARAQLLDYGDPVRSAKRVMKEYVTQQLACLPAGTNTFDKYLVAAYETIMSLFVHNRLHSEDLPTVLYCRAQKETGEAIEKHLKERKILLVRYIHMKLNECGFAQLPTEDQCTGASVGNPVNWDPSNLPRGRDQPLESYEEQMEVIRLSKSLILHYKSSPMEYTKGICHVGAGGVGKTTVLLIELLYALCQGLNAGITAMLSERAQELAGGHIHDLFGMQGSDMLSPGQMAERSISSLFRNPEKLEYLRILDVLALDEAGAIPCELLSAMCTVLRYIRNCNRPYGGMIILATMDYLQIDPVSGRHPLMSPVFTSCFFFRELVHSVRAALDAQWRRIQKITRMTGTELSSEATRQEFIALLTTTCTFVSSLDDERLPENILFAFGKRSPIRKEEKRILQSLQTQRTIPFVISTALDEERTIDGNFQPASRITSSCLDKQVKEPRKLVLYERGRYQITYNKKRVHSNSQIAVLFDLPNRATVESKAPIKMVVAPPGCRFIPDSNITKEELLSQGWNEKKIGTPNRHTVQNVHGRVRGKRKQYGLRHHIGSTIHGVMGQTLNSLLTRVERGDRAHPYSLWLASQVVVLLSRTRIGKETYFWTANGTTPQETAEAIYDLLCKTTPFRDYLSKLLRSLCNEDNNSQDFEPYTVNNAESILRPRDIPLPTHRLGYVYLLVSTRDLSYVYIGSTFDLISRWKQHNSGHGATQTSPWRLRPWAILAYIVGFDGVKHRYLSVEQRWIAAKQDMIRDPAQHVSVQSIHNLGKDVVATYNRENPNHCLRFVSCGTIERLSAA